MKNRKITHAMTLGGIFAATYGVLTAISVYALPILSVFGLIILPIFAAYYSSVFSIKETIVFNLVTLLICFLIGIGDPYYALLYVLPTLFIGDIFGLLNHLKVPYYSTIFYQCLAFSFCNGVTFYLVEILYDIPLFSQIISDVFVLTHYGIILLFILSSAEAIVSSLLIQEQLKKLAIQKEKETSMPLLVPIVSCTCFLLSIPFYFLSSNLFNFCIFLSIIASCCTLLPTFLKLKGKEIILTIYLILSLIACFILAHFSYSSLIGVMLSFPLCLLSVVKVSLFIYNKKKKE